MNPGRGASPRQKDIAMPRLLVAFALAATVFAVPLPAVSGESVYTDASIDRCENLLTNPDQVDIDMGTISVKCAGYKGYPFYFDESDVRQSTHFGHLSDDILRAAGETFAVFNHIGDRIEWRVDARGVPRATILRYILENPNPETSQPDKAFYGQVLVVSRVGQPDDLTGCVTAYVDALANPDANEMARKLADEQAPTFSCGREQPVFHGKVGDRSSEPVYNFPDLSQAQ
jgi:hypothetical protein